MRSRSFSRTRSSKSAGSAARGFETLTLIVVLASVFFTASAGGATPDDRPPARSDTPVESSAPVEKDPGHAPPETSAGKKPADLSDFELTVVQEKESRDGGVVYLGADNPFSMKIRFADPIPEDLPPAAVVAVLGSYRFPFAERKSERELVTGLLSIPPGSEHSQENISVLVYRGRGMWEFPSNAWAAVDSIRPEPPVGLSARSCRNDSFDVSWVPGEHPEQNAGYLVEHFREG